MNHVRKISRHDVLTLYASMIRHAKRFDDYNFRHHALRRIKYGFRQNMQRSDGISPIYSDGLKQLDVLKRQVMLGKLYPETSSVIEARNKKYLEAEKDE